MICSSSAPDRYACHLLSAISPRLTSSLVSRPPNVVDEALRFDGESERCFFHDPWKPEVAEAVALDHRASPARRVVDQRARRALDDLLLDRIVDQAADEALRDIQVVDPRLGRIGRAEQLGLGDLGRELLVVAELDGLSRADVDGAGARPTPLVREGVRNRCTSARC